MKHLNSDLNGYVFKDYQPVEPVNEETMEVIETYCNTFGCGKKLSLIETLLGNKCIEHSKIKPQEFSNALL